MLRSCVILQFEGVHEVTIPSFIGSLNRLGWRPTVVLNERCRGRGDIFATMTDDEFDVAYLPLNGRDDWAQALDIARSARPEFVVVNTYQRDGIVAAATELRTPVIGLVHNTRVFVDGTQTVASHRRSDVALLTLWDHVSHSLRSSLSTRGDNIETFYMTALPTAPAARPASAETTVAITGAIDRKNRDLDMLARGLAELHEQRAEQSFKFIFCGGGADRDHFESEVRRMNLDGQVEFLTPGDGEGFVPYVDYLATLKSADLIGALLPTGRRDYLDHKVTSGALSALALATPLWADSATLSTYQLPGVGYASDDMSSGLERLGSITPEDLEQIRRKCVIIRQLRETQSDIALANSIERISTP